MKKLNLMTIALSALAYSTGSLAENIRVPKSRVGIETCILAAQAKHKGKMVKLDVKLEKNRPVYEFDIESADGTAWDVECDGITGKVTEIEQEVKSADDPLFKSKMKISLDDAKAIALKAYPGQIRDEATEYEIESNGDASYEFDIDLTNGKELKVEVDATTGKIVEANEELYQIGRE